MSLKALVTALVLAATSTAALADPVVREHRDEPAQTDVSRDHREGGWHKRPSWMVIASGRLTRGRDVIKTKVAASKLELVAQKGSIEIDQVVVRFANGGVQKVSLAQTLNASNKSLTIALDGGVRNVTSVTVFGKGSRRSAFQLLAA